MRALFLASPGPIAARPLWEWLDAGHDVAELWVAGSVPRSQWKRDRRLGYVRPGWSVSAAIHRRRLAVRATGALRRAPELTKAARNLDADVVISSCFPYILPVGILDHYASRAVNLHPALLPAYRGPTPIAWMLYHGDADTHGGVTLHEMTPRLDEGPVIDQQVVPYSRAGWFRAWEAYLAKAAGELIRDALPRFLAGELRSRPQLGEASYHAPMDTAAMTLDRGVSASRAAYLLETMASFRPGRVHAGGKPRQVVALQAKLGPPTGGPPVLRPLSIDVDLSDARVRLMRKRPLTSKYWQARRYAEFWASAPENPARRAA